MFNIEIARKQSNLNYPPFAPLIWLDGADASSMTISTTISQWRDKGRNGNNASQATGGLQPTLTSAALNGKSAVTFGGAQGMSIPNISLGLFTIFFVFRASVNGFLYEQSPDANANPGSYWYTDTSQTVRVNRTGGASNRNLSTNWGIGNVWRIVANTFDGTNLGNRMFINNVEQALTDFMTTADPGTTVATNTIFLASRNNAGVFLTGDIAEILVYDSRLQDQYRSAVFTYLNRKWAVY